MNTLRARTKSGDKKNQGSTRDNPHIVLVVPPIKLQFVLVPVASTALHDDSESAVRLVVLGVEACDLLPKRKNPVSGINPGNKDQALESTFAALGEMIRSEAREVVGSGGLVEKGLSSSSSAACAEAVANLLWVDNGFRGGIVRTAKGGDGEQRTEAHRDAATTSLPFRGSRPGIRPGSLLRVLKASPLIVRKARSVAILSFVGY